MAHINLELGFDALEIRNTATHTGTTISNFDFKVKTIVIENGLDKAATFQCQASVYSDFSSSFDIGATFDCSASSSIFQSCDTYFPYMRLNALCLSAPTTGALTVHFIQYGG